MSGLEYYHIDGYIVKNTAGTVVSNYYKSHQGFPTAPMYRDIETYNGRCAMWLKRVHLGGTQVQHTLRQLYKHYDCAIVLRGVGCLNQVHLQINDGLTYPGGADPFLNANAPLTTARGGVGGNAIFHFTPNRGHLEADTEHLEPGDFGYGVGLSLGTDNDHGTAIPAQPLPPSASEGDGKLTNNPATAYHLDNAKYFTTYENDSVGNMATAVIVGNLWGADIPIEFLKGEKGTFKAGHYLPMSGLLDDVYYEFVVKPLRNEPNGKN